MSNAIYIHIYIIGIYLYRQLIVTSNSVCSDSSIFDKTNLYEADIIMTKGIHSYFGKKFTVT